MSIRTLKVFLAITLVIAILQACGSSSTGPSDPKTAGNIVAVDTLIRQEIDQENIPGAVIRIQQGDSVLHHKAYGFAQKYQYGMKLLDSPDTMATDHLFDLASLTKVFATTFGVMLLVDQGEIALDQPIHTWLPEFKTPEKREITIRHLLTHSAGLYQWKPTYYHASAPAEQYQYIADLPLNYPVGEGRHYSDLGFMLLGEIIRRVSNQPIDEFLDEQFYNRLELEKTLFNPLDHGFNKEDIAATSHGNPFEKQMVHDDAFGYSVDVAPDSWDSWRQYTLRGEVNDGNAWYGVNGVAGHAGLFSTAADLQKMVNLLLEEGRYQSEQLISEAVIDTFLTEDRFGNGLGWAMDPEVFSAEGVPTGSFGHTGFTGTSVVVIPEYDLSIILLTNRQNVGRQENGYYFNLGPLRQGIVDVVLKKYKATLGRF